MSDPLEDEKTQASLDSALERESQHDRERDAAHKQGEIQHETREHHLDEG